MPMTANNAAQIAPDAKTSTGASLAERTASAQKFWGDYFGFYDILNQAAPYRNMIEGHVAMLDPKEGEQVLDAGCGTGNVSVELIKRKPNLIGVDFVESALDVCREKVPQAEYRFANLRLPLEFADATFDKIACCVVLQFMDQGAAEFAVRQFYRVVKPGGRVTLTVFVKGFNRRAVLFGTFRGLYQNGGVIGLLRFLFTNMMVTARVMSYVKELKNLEETGEHVFYSREEFEALATQAGFVVKGMEKTFADQSLTVLLEKPAVPAAAG